MGELSRRHGHSVSEVRDSGGPGSPTGGAASVARPACSTAGRTGRGDPAPLLLQDRTAAMGAPDSVGSRRPVTSVAEGWYPDPDDVTAKWLRYWEGEDWSPIPAKLASRSERKRLSWPGEDSEAA